MKYTYDGAYGAEVVIWSRINGEYQVYHYDYRGSVVTVTDKDGNITDTLKYDAYGSTVEHRGSSILLFGYNGQYGVQTDKSGFLYMRTRYYNPVFRRFMSADVIDGSIADSTTLNLYAYVNGNPISFVDPFGLCRDDKNTQNTMSLDDRLKYIETHSKGNMIYDILKQWNIYNH